ncbi:unnamed protein product [Paramecium primaurelia]|uniref:SET domain-containing protein n=1 Tax=Paramecium primaurelia TaxID=5886 RepID=A0A8S1L679_PARPR|nr:unnamed protein product [Paramecium primaurelia]
MKRHSIGKTFTKLKGLNKADPDAIIPETPKLIEDFIESLNSQGAIINKVKYAIFQTKNGLKYPGLIATEKIEPNDNLVILPRETLLTTKQAFESPLKPMFLEFPQFFSPKFMPKWQYHIILSFLLYEYQKGTESKWHLLINNFPKDIDYAVFWKREDLELLQDQRMVKHAIEKNRYLIATFQTLQYITSKYPDLFKPGIVTMDNIIWIYTSIVTRCFGGQGLKYVTMVPFCELFNHENADVCYDLQQNDGRTKYNYEFMTQKVIKGEKDDDELSVSSFDNSLCSEDDISDSEYVTSDYHEYQEFNFDEYYEKSIKNFTNNYNQMFEKLKLQNEDQESFNRKIKEQQEFQLKLRKELNIKLNIQKDVFQLAINSKAMLFQNLDFGDNFSILFLGQIFHILDQSIKMYFQEELSSFKAREIFAKIEQICSCYLDNWYTFNNVVKKNPVQQRVNSFSQKIVKRPSKVIPTVESFLKMPVDRSFNYYQNVWENENFKNLLMRTRDYFEKGSQVYFCYSQLSNRMMILKYGMALEYNKFNSAFLRVEYLKYLQKKEAIWIAHRFKLDKFKRFKLKFIKPPYELIIFCKLVYWDLNIHTVETIFQIQDLKLEKKALNLALEIMDEENSKFTEKIEDLEQQLKDKSLGYHEYFAIVYRLERLRIYRYNINLINIMIIAIDKIINGVPFEQAIEKTEFDFDFYLTNRHTLKKYFDELRCALYQSK